MHVAGKRVLITGASRGLGAAFARTFHDAGAQLVLVARNAEQLAEIAAETNGDTIAGDLIDEGFVDALFEQAALNGPIDIVINNAGMEVAAPLAKQSTDAIRNVFRLNVEAPALLCRSAINHIGNRPGWLVNVSSLAMAVDTPGFATYGASKAALSSFSSSLRQELSATSIGGTVVEIGLTDTDMATDILGSGGAAAALFDRYKKLGLSPLLDPVDVAEAVVAAVENERSYVRMPKRAMAFPMLTNIARRTGTLIQTGNVTDQ